MKRTRISGAISLVRPAAVLLLSAVLAAHAAFTLPDATPLTFAEAQLRMLDSSDKLAAARAAVEAELMDMVPGLYATIELLPEGAETVFEQTEAQEKAT